MLRKRFNAGFLAVLAVVVLTSLLSSCAPNEQSTSGKEFVIGLLAPLTGDVADYGARGRNAALLAVDEINASGGIKGKKIRLIIEDDKGSAKDAVAAMLKLVNVDKVPVVIGGLMSGIGLAIAPIAQQNKVVLMAPGSSAPAYRNEGDYCFRDWTSDDLDGKIMANYMFKNKGIHEVAVLTMQNDYCLGLSKAFKSSFVQLGGKVIFEEQFPPGTSQFQSILAKMKGVHPKAVFLSAQPKEGGFAVKQMAELGIKAQIGSNFSVDSPDFLGIAGTAANGIFFTTPAFDPKSKDPQVSQFVSKYKKRYGEDPDTTAGHFYDAVRVVAAAANAARDLTPAAIRDALFQVKDFPGVTGKMTFDDHGDVTEPVMIKVVKDGKPQLVELYGVDK